MKKHIHRSQIVDMDVQNKSDYRIIASWPDGKSEPTYWVTNLPRERYSAHTIIKLYRLRWQIELPLKLKDLKHSLSQEVNLRFVTGFFDTSLFAVPKGYQLQSMPDMSMPMH
ncbi:MAG: IS4 transposase [Oleiphilaceae bacterium]